jgi:signal transduction histidine kinase
VCLIVAEAKFSYPMSAVMFLPGIVSYDYERQVLRGFFSKENFGASLQKAANLESEKRLAELSIKEMQHVIANIAHDLKTPMQGICMGLDQSTKLVASQLNTACPSRAAPSQDQYSLREVYQTLETLKDTAGFMVLSINRALDFSKV